MASFYKEIAALLAKHGWTFHRQAKGSHEMWKHQDSGRLVTVPQNCKKKHTANAIMKQTGIDKRF